jgi:hypothetical protein
MHIELPVLEEPPRPHGHIACPTTAAPTGMPARDERPQLS